MIAQVKNCFFCFSRRLAWANFLFDIDILYEFKG